MNTSAVEVYGQGGDFTTRERNKGGISRFSLADPTGVGTDRAGNLYVVDSDNHRVVRFPSGKTTADGVWGHYEWKRGSEVPGGHDQYNDPIGAGDAAFVQGDPGTDSVRFWAPWGVALDSEGNLYVTDMENFRILFFPVGSLEATRVYGQSGDLTTRAHNEGEISYDGLGRVYAVALDSLDNLYVADGDHHRVLYYPKGQTSATRVYGQGGDFTTGEQNKGGVISPDSLNFPFGVALDSQDNLYVSELINNRVLFYPKDQTTATRVFGQGGSFNTGDKNKGGISRDSISGPWSIALDGSDNLYVADYRNERVLYFPKGQTSATQVYGQGGDFSTGDANKGGISRDSLSIPYAVALDSDDNLYVADAGNNRVLKYASLTVSPLMEETLEAHNKFRREHAEAPLIWDDTLANYAQNWANTLVSTGKFEHSPKPPRTYGENLAAGTGAFGITAAVDMWASERTQFDFSNPTIWDYTKTGHFTQVVWAQTTKVGCGVAIGKDGMTYVVCSYDPAGNLTFNGEKQSPFSK